MLPVESKVIADTNDLLLFFQLRNQPQNAKSTLVQTLFWICTKHIFHIQIIEVYLNNAIKILSKIPEHT